LARFHFQVRTQSHVAFTEAADLLGLEEARTEAARRVGVLLTEHAQQIWADKDWQMDVTDGRGLILFTINVSAYVAPAAQGSERPSGL
jgi:hypothetical protein